MERRKHLKRRPDILGRRRNLYVGKNHTSITARVRSGPGTNYRQAGTLSAGQPFTAIGSQGEWVQIAGGGWVNAHYVTAN